MQVMLRQIHRRRLLLPLPWSLAKAVGALGDIQASLLPFAPPMTSDQVDAYVAGR